ncbi:MAG: sulfatase [Planctomycetota bacterium]
MTRDPSPAPRLRLLLTLPPLLVPLLVGCSDPEPRRNLLVIAVGSLRADRLGNYGYERPTSPVLDRLCAESVVFEDAHAAAPWTLPSFASLLTSQFPTTHACWQFEDRLANAFTTLPEVLRRVGYRTGAVVSHVFLGRGHGLRQGFQDFDDELVRAPAEELHHLISSPEVSDRAIAFLRRAAVDASRPWCLLAHYGDPHAIYKTHPGITEHFGPKPPHRYDGEIAFADQHIGRLLAELEALGLTERTVIALVGGHGEEFGEHGGRSHGRTLFTEVERVPLAWRVPGTRPRRVSAVVSLVDFMPTTIELLGVRRPRLHMAGQSLRPLMRGEPTAARPTLLEARPNGLKRDLAAYVDEEWKLVEDVPRGGGRARYQLFDRRADPGELVDLAAQRPEIVDALCERLDEAIFGAEAAAGMFGFVREGRAAVRRE